MKSIFSHFGFAQAVAGLLFLAAAGSANGQFRFVTNNGAITITGTSISFGAVVVPGMTNGFPVTSIASNACNGGTFTSLVIPDAVTNIEASAFESCTKLTNVSLGNGVQTIGAYAFGGCTALPNIVVPNSVTSYGTGAFDGCSGLTNAVLSCGAAIIPYSLLRSCPALKNVTIPNGVIYIVQESFESSGLIRLNIPDTVTNIEYFAFDACPSLTNVVVGSGLLGLGQYAFENYQGVPVNVFFRGNPPPTTGTPAARGIAYYLPTATGWGTNYGMLPTVLWNPQAQTADGLFGVRTNHFGFNVTGTTNIPVVVEVCTNLSSGKWTMAQSFLLTNGSVYFSDTFAKTNGFAGHYYRIRSP